MSKKPIQSSLFRFVTLRSPQLIEDKDTGFVSITDTDTDAEEGLKTDSIFYQTISAFSDSEDLEAKKAALLEIGNDEDSAFEPLESRTKVKELHPNLLLFSSWLMRNKSYLPYTEIKEYLDNIGEDFTLSFLDEANIWDNLFYQTINKTSVHVREACIQILVANKFVKAFNQIPTDISSEDASKKEEEFIKRANASVIIPKGYLLPTEESAPADESTASAPALDYLREGLETRLIEERIATYKTAITELKKEEKLYNQKVKESYEAAVEAYDAAVAAEYERTRTIDEATGEISYPDLALPQMSLEAPPTLSFQENSGDIFARTAQEPSMLSSETQKLLQEKTFEYVSDFSEVISLFEDKIDASIKERDSKNNNQVKTVSIGGSTFDLGPETLLDPYCYIGQLTRTVESTIVNIHIDMDIAADNSITNSTFTLTKDSDNSLIQHTRYEDKTTIQGRQSTRFHFHPVPIFEDVSYTFEGTFHFSNGDEVTFISKITISESTHIVEFGGCGLLKEEEGEDNGGNGPDPGSNPSTSSGVPSLKGITNLGIADFRRVEQEVCCYAPGEVSHIENILAREYKEKATRSLVSSEVTVEESSEREVESLTDTTSTVRNELQNEAASVIDEQNSSDFGATASVSIGTFNASTNFNRSSSNAISQSNSQAQSYAEEVTERALERVVQKISSKRTSRVLREFEENNKHGFDNTKGEKNITGVYRWVDKVYKNWIVNYGKRLMYEFSIPEPSKFLKKALYLKDELTTNELGLIAPSLPPTPSSFDLNDASSLNSSNYQNIAAAYKAEVPPKPNDQIKVSQGFSLTGGPEELRWQAGSGSIPIPEGYQADSANASASFVFHPDKEESHHYSINIANQSFQSYGSLLADSEIPFKSLGGIVGNLDVAYNTGDLGSFSLSVSVSCGLTAAGLEEWQNETYAILMDAYRDRVNEYNSFKAEEANYATTEDGEVIRFNPSFNRMMERRELKRLAIELLTKSTGIVTSQNNYESDSAEGALEIKATEAFEQHAAVVKFFEQAFDWEIMAYQLYPYYYAEKKGWKNLVTQKEDADPVFQAFLQSGMTRTVVPVRPGFEAAVNWYMTTGEVWNGQGLVLETDDELHLSIAEEMLEPAGKIVGNPWETRIPTSLTILQAKSASLDVGGLPCDPNCSEPNEITESTFVITGEEDSNATCGIGFDTVAEDNTIK